MITLEELKEWLEYDPETGFFKRLKSNNRRIKVGEIIPRPCKTSTYDAIQVNGVTYKAHRLAWLYMHGELPEMQIDHINHNKKDNRIANLRLATWSQNQVYKPMYKNNTSGFKGVSKGKVGFTAVAYKDGKRVWLGEYKDINKAAEAYKAFAKQNHGEFYHE